MLPLPPVLIKPSRAAVDAAGWGVAAVLGGVAAARGGKAVHPDGIVHDARVVIDGSADAPPGSSLLSEPREHAAIVRFSRSVGLPRPVPDLLGLSLRVLDAYGPDEHQDVLVITSLDIPVLHHLFVPATDAQQRVYSSSLPYRAGDRSFLLGVLPDPTSPRPGGEDEFARVRAAAATGELRFGLGVAPVGGRFRRVGTIHVGAPRSPELDALRFNPVEHTGGGLQPAGALNRMRAMAYPLSQRGWGARDHKADAQERADRAVAADARRR